MRSDELSKNKKDLEENIQNLENSNKQARQDILNAKEAIELYKKKLEEFTKYKSQIDDLTKDTEHYQEEIDKIKNDL